MITKILLNTKNKWVNFKNEIGLKNKYACLIGPNGSGKTKLINSVKSSKQIKFFDESGIASEVEIEKVSSGLKNMTRSIINRNSFEFEDLERLVNILKEFGLEKNRVKISLLSNSAFVQKMIKIDNKTFAFNYEFIRSNLNSNGWTDLELFFEYLNLKNLWLLSCKEINVDDSQAGVILSNLVSSIRHEELAQKGGDFTSPGRAMKAINNLNVDFYSFMLSKYSSALYSSYYDDPEFLYFDDICNFIDEASEIKDKRSGAQYLIPIVKFLNEGQYYQLVLNSLANITSIEGSSGEMRLYEMISSLISFNRVDAKNKLVLIDEPEIYLHPTWVSKFTSIVDRCLDNVSVLVATHSTLICSGFSSRNIYLMPNFENPEYETFGISNDVLSMMIFGLDIPVSLNAVNAKIERKNRALELLKNAKD